MDEFVKKFFNMGIVHFMAYPQSQKNDEILLDTIKKTASDDYFDAIEITHIENTDVREKVKALLEQSKMKVCYGAQPRLLSSGLNPNDLDEGKRLKAQKLLCESLDEAKYFGAPGIAFLAGKYEKSTIRDSYNQLLKTTMALCGYGKTKNMSVTLEVFDFDLDKKSLIGPAPLAYEFASDIRKEYSNFGLMVDLSHIPQTYETPEFVIRTLKPYITHFHIGNAVIKEGCEAFGDTHPRFGFPESVNDMPQVLEFLKIIKEEGFFKKENPYVLSFEVKPWKDECPDMVVANAKRTFNRAWALL